VPVAILAVTTILAVSACGISNDGQPRAIPDNALIGSTTTTFGGGDTNTQLREYVYLVQGSSTSTPAGETLAQVLVMVPGFNDEADLVRRVIEELISQETGNGLTNAIPSGTEVLSVSLNADRTEVSLDLNEEFYDIQAALQRQAFAQIVFTATGITPAGIDSVRFLKEGQPVSASTSDDVTPAAGTAVTRDSYPSLKSSIESVAPTEGP
jgi:hypothetical protein